MNTDQDESRPNPIREAVFAMLEEAKPPYIAKHTECRWAFASRLAVGYYSEHGYKFICFIELLDDQIYMYRPSDLIGSTYLGCTGIWISDPDFCEQVWIRVQTLLKEQSFACG